MENMDLKLLISLLKKGDIKSFRKAKEKYGLTFSEFSDLRQIIETLEKIAKDRKIKIDENSVKPLKKVGYKTILKEIGKIKAYLGAGNTEKAFIELLKLEKGIKEKLEKGEKKAEVNGKEIQRLISWYVSLWQNEGKLPPEGYLISEKGKLRAYLFKLFEKLSQVLTEEEIKEFYKFWFELEVEVLPKEIKTNYAYKPLYIAKSGRDLKTFMKRINLIRALKEDLEKRNKNYSSSYSKYEWL